MEEIYFIKEINNILENQKLNIQEKISQFNQLYDTLSIAEKKEYIKYLTKVFKNTNIFEIQTKQQLNSIPSWIIKAAKHNKKIEFYDNDDESINGSYKYDKKKIYINQQILNNRNGQKINFTLIHELRHAYQHKMKNNPLYFRNKKTIELFDFKKKMKNLFINDRALNTTTDIQNLSFAFYYLQKHERDANEYASKYTQQEEDYISNINKNISILSSYYEIPIPQNEEEKQVLLDFLDKCYTKIIAGKDPNNDLEATIMYDNV